MTERGPRGPPISKRDRFRFEIIVGPFGLFPTKLIDIMNDRAQTRREGRLRLGFLTNVPFTSDAGGARRGLEEAIATFEYAESIGFDAG